MDILRTDTGFFTVCTRAVATVDKGTGEDNRVRIGVFGQDADHETMMCVAEEILECLDCKVYVPQSGHVMGEERMESCIREFSWFVILVSSGLFDGQNSTFLLLKELIRSHARILPIQIEDTAGLGGRFTEQFGKLHVLKRFQPAYSTALGWFISERVDHHRIVGLSPEQQEIRQHQFRFRTFISYRKKDAQYLGRFLERIRRMPELRDMSVFYDNDLVPGEDYNERLEQEINGSDVVIFIITPNMLEAGNYVIRREYPQAVAGHKLLLPVIMADTDETALAECFPAFSAYVKFGEDVEFAERMTAFRTEHFGAVPGMSAEQKYFLGYAFEQGEGTERNLKLAETLYREAASEGYHSANAKLAFLHVDGLVPDTFPGETERLLEKAMYAYAEKLPGMDPSSETSYGFGMAFARLSEELYALRWEHYDHDKVRETVLCMNEAVKFLRKVGVMSARWPIYLPALQLGTMSLYEGDLETADYYFMQMQQHLDLYRGMGNIYTRFHIMQKDVAQGHLLTEYLKKGDLGSEGLIPARDRLEKALQEVMEFHFVRDIQVYLMQVVKDYYYVGRVLMQIGQHDAAVEIYQTIGVALYETGLVSAPVEASELGNIIQIEEPVLQHNLHFNSLEELKQILDKYTCWFVLDLDERGLQEAFTFAGGFIPEGRWGDTDGNAIASAYKCYKCDERLYKFIFPEGRDPKLYVGPDKDRYLSPARVFLCPGCGKMFATPKGRKMITGPVFQASPFSSEKNKLGRAIADLWFRYLDEIGDISATRKE